MFSLSLLPPDLHPGPERGVGGIRHRAFSKAGYGVETDSIDDEVKFLGTLPR